MLIAVFDACVFYPGALRDLLLHLANVKVVRARWTDEIHMEWIRSVLRNRPDLNRESLEQTSHRMNQKFRYARVRNYEDLIETLRLPDPNDRHVLAAAIRSQASIIVTNNLSDFPPASLNRYKIEAISPDEFIVRLIRDHADAVLQAVNDHRTRLARPPKTPEEYLATLTKQGLPQTVAFLREHITEI